MTLSDSRLGLGGGIGATGGAGVTGRMPSASSPGMHVRVEERHQLREVGEQLVAEHRRVGRPVAALLDQRRARARRAPAPFTVTVPVATLISIWLAPRASVSVIVCVTSSITVVRPRSRAPDLGGRSAGRAGRLHRQLAGCPSSSRSRSAARRRPPRTRSRRRRPTGGSEKKPEVGARHRARRASPSRSGSRPALPARVACSRPRLQRVDIVEDGAAILAVDALAASPARDQSAAIVPLRPSLRPPPRADR